MSNLTKAELVERIGELESRYDVFDKARDVRKNYGDEQALIFIVGENIQVGLEKDFFGESE